MEKGGEKWKSYTIIFYFEFITLPVSTMVRLLPGASTDDSLKVIFPGMSKITKRYVKKNNLAPQHIRTFTAYQYRRDGPCGASLRACHRASRLCKYYTTYCLLAQEYFLQWAKHYYPSLADAPYEKHIKESCRLLHLRKHLDRRPFWDRFGIGREIFSSIWWIKALLTTNMVNSESIMYPRFYTGRVIKRAPLAAASLIFFAACSKFFWQKVSLVVKYAYES